MCTLSIIPPVPFEELWSTVAELLDEAKGKLSLTPEHSLSNDVKVSGVLSIIGIPVSRIMAVHSMVFNFCSAKSGEDLYFCFKTLMETNVSEQRNVAMLLHDDMAMLVFLCKKWNEYRVLGTISSHVLAYMNRNFVKTEASNNKVILEVEALVHAVWRDGMCMCKPLRTRFADATLALVKLDRNGQAIDFALVAAATQWLIRLGLDEYKEHFEKCYLQEISRVHEAELARVDQDDVRALMQCVGARSDEEQKRFRKLQLHSTTEQEIDKVLIGRHIAAMVESVPILLDELQQADLARMYTLLVRLGAVGLDPVRAALEQHVAAAGRHAIAAEVEQAKDEPDVFVAILLRVFRKYQKLVREAFCDDAGFIAAQDKAFRDFVNNNAATQAEAADDKDSGAQVAKAPQMLAKYCDMILRKGPKHISDEAEMERTLDDVVSLFKYLPDKDVFMLVYKKLLSKRFIGDQSGNDDFEAAMINKLKAAQGFEYTSSLQRMVQDIATSKDINTSFKEWCEQNDEKVALDLSISVLATGTWPLQPQSTQFVAPQALVGPIDLFKKFYSTKYSGRKLTYLHQLGKADAVVNYAMKGRLRVTVSTFQLGVLVHFDTANADQLTLADLMSATLLQDQPLKVALLGMLKMKFIACAAGPKHTTWDESTVFSLVKGFKSPRNRIVLNVPIAADGLKTAPQANIEAPEIRRERELKLQAAIVRIMKARKTLSHQQLISEATIAVQKWFTPKFAVIKKVVEQLIESEYLARETDESALMSYNFLA
jgi:cullin 1